MTMHSFSHILDLCLLLLMIFRLLGQSILLFTATDIIKQCPCTSDSIIFFCSLLTNFSPNSGQVGVSTSHLLLMRLSPHTSPKLRFAGLQLCLALQSSHCHHRFTSLPAVGTALLPAVGCALASRVLGSLPWLFLFTDSWVPTLAVFFGSSLKLSPLTATRNLCRPRFVTTLDMMHCLLLKIIDNS